MSVADLRATASAVVLAALASCSGEPSSQPDRNAPQVDVASYMARRDGCDALLRYRPSDAEDAHDLKSQRFTMCHGLDAELAALRRDYARDPAAIGLLARYRPLGFDE